MCHPWPLASILHNRDNLNLPCASQHSASHSAPEVDPAQTEPYLVMTESSPGQSVLYPLLPETSPTLLGAYPPGIHERNGQKGKSGSNCLNAFHTILLPWIIQNENSECIFNSCIFPKWNNFNEVDVLRSKCQKNVRQIWQVYWDYYTTKIVMH